MLRRIFFYPALVVLCWVYSITAAGIDFDLWARMAVGKIFFQTGHVINNDIFSYTATRHWIDHEWGSGVIFYFLGDKFGDIGLFVLKAALFFSILFLISRIIKLQNPKLNAHLNILFYFIVILAAFGGIGQTVRCQLFTFTFFTLWLYLLERIRRGETRLLWIMPVTMLVWANLHGGFVAGLGLLGMYGVGEFLNKKPYMKYFLTLIPTSLITLINPYGYKYLLFIIQATTMKRELIAEWQATDLLISWNYWYSFKIVLIITFISLAFYFIRKRPKFQEVDKVKFIVLAVTLYLALTKIKLQAFFVIAAAGFVYHDFYAIFEVTGNFLKIKYSKVMPKLLHNLDLIKNGALYAFILGAGTLLIIFNPVQITIPVNKFPVGSIEFVRQNNLKGNLMTVFHWGSYAAWKLYPDCLIALDGRYEEVYQDSTFYYVAYFTSYANAPEKGIIWDNVLRRYHSDIIILGKESLPKRSAFESLKKNKDWTLVYEDFISGVFVRAEDVKDHYIKPKMTPESLLQTFDEKYDTKLDFSTKI